MADYHNTINKFSEYVQQGHSILRSNSQPKTTSIMNRWGTHLRYMGLNHVRQSARKTPSRDTSPIASRPSRYTHNILFYRITRHWKIRTPTEPYNGRQQPPTTSQRRLKVVVPTCWLWPPNPGVPTFTSLSTNPQLFAVLPTIFLASASSGIR